MKIKSTLLQAYLKENNMTALSLAQKMGVDVSEIEKLLSDEAVGVKTAQEFIGYFGADKAQELIDWEAIGKENPLACDADNDED